MTKRAQRKGSTPPADTASAAVDTPAAGERDAGGAGGSSGGEVGAEAALEALGVQWPQRRREARSLVAALGWTGSEGASSAALLVHGGAGSGKTAVVRDTLRRLNRPHAYASCLTCTTSGLLFEVRALPSRLGLEALPTVCLGDAWAQCTPSISPVRMQSLRTSRAT
jgi:hypothetical protein